MIVLYSIASVLLLFFILCSFPIRVRVDSELVVRIRWLFLKMRIRSIEGELKTDIKLFNRKIRLFQRKKDTKPPSEPKKDSPQKKKKKKSRKITPAMVYEGLKDIAVRKMARVVGFFLIRCLKSIRIKLLKADIGLQDYYWQGIITGLLHSVPDSDNLQLRGNFQDVTQGVMVIHISILKIIKAVILLLLTFPYFKTFRLYRRVYLQKG